MTDTIEQLVNKLAPARTSPTGIEHYSAENLLRRVGVDAEDLQELLETGTLCPCGKAHKGASGEDVYPFRSEDLNALRRLLVVEGLKAIAAEHQPEDSAEGERAFCRAAEFIFAMERRNVSKSRNPTTLRFAQGALSRAAGRVIELEVPVLTGKVARDRYVKRLKDEDQARRDSNLLRAGATGALAGALLPWRKLKSAHRALLGAGAGAAGVPAVRKATEGTQDRYGERSRGAKRAEAVPALAGAGVAAYAATRRIPAHRTLLRERLRAERIPLLTPRSASCSVSAQRFSARRRLIGGAAALGGTPGGLKAGSDDDPETGVRGGTLAGGLKGAAIGTAGVLGAPYAYSAARSIVARLRGLRPGMLRGLF